MHFAIVEPALRRLELVERDIVILLVAHASVSFSADVSEVLPRLSALRPRR